MSRWPSRADQHRSIVQRDPRPNLRRAGEHRHGDRRGVVAVRRPVVGGRHQIGVLDAGGALVSMVIGNVLEKAVAFPAVSVALVRIACPLSVSTFEA